MSHQSDVSNAHPLADIHSTGAADATQPAAVSLKLRLEHYPSTSSADESIGELPAPRDVSCLSRTLSSEPASPLSTGRSQVCHNDCQTLSARVAACSSAVFI
jgi:hypothetical protein